MSNELRRAVTALVGTKSGDRFFAELLFDMVRMPDLTCKSMGVGIRGLDTVLVYNPNLLIRWGMRRRLRYLSMSCCTLFVNIFRVLCGQVIIRSVTWRRTL